MSAVATSEKAYADTIIRAIQSALPDDVRVEWNGRSYTLHTEIPVEELSKIFDAVSRTFWETTSDVYLARPKTWEYRNDYQAIVWLSEPIGEHPTFLIGESWNIRRLKPECSLLKYTFTSAPLIRADSFATSLQEYLGVGSQVTWNGRGYTIETSKDTHSRFFRDFFRAHRDDRLYDGQEHSIAYSGEKIIFPDGNFLFGISLHEHIPFRILY